MDFGIITFVNVEREAVCKVFGLGDEARVSKGSRVYWCGTVDGIRGGGAYEIVVAQSSDMANVDAALLTNDMIHHWDPQKILAVGIAGSADHDLDLGDIALGQFVYYYERGKATAGGTKPEPYMYRSDARLWNHVVAVARWDEKIPVLRPDGREKRPKLCPGVIASGEKVIAVDAARDGIKSGHRKIIAIEMEGYGVSAAAWGSAETVGCLVIKAISDKADVAKDDRWQLYAATVAALFALHFLKDRPIESRDRLMKSSNGIPPLNEPRNSTHTSGSREPLRFIPPESTAPVGGVTADKIAALIQSAQSEGVPEAELQDLKKLLQDLRTGSQSLPPPQMTVYPVPSRQQRRAGGREMIVATVPLADPLADLEDIDFDSDDDEE